MTKHWLCALALVTACEGKAKSPPPATAPAKRQPADTATATATATAMVRVEEGWFASGCAALPSQATREDAITCVGRNPPRKLWLSAFEIGATEVTVEAFAACVTANMCDSIQNSHPVLAASMPALVRYEQAEKYCAWKGQRLPTEAEWEKAARGTDGRMYPWGNEVPTCASAALEWDPVDQRRELICKIKSLSAVGTHPQDRSPYGALDMAGNAAEWVSDLLVLDRGTWRDWVAPGSIVFADTSVVNPRGPTPDVYAAAAHRLARRDLKHVMRGGLSNAAVGTRSQIPMDFDDDDHPTAGFRCAQDLPSGPPPTAAPVVEASISVVERDGVVTIQSSGL